MKRIALFFCFIFSFAAHANNIIVNGTRFIYPGNEKGTVAKLAMRQPFVLFKGLTFQKLCLPGAFR
ncbi:hypothetical protein AB9D27_24280, partial [Enterobacter cloacae]